MDLIGSLEQNGCERHASMRECRSIDRSSKVEGHRKLFWFETQIIVGALQKHSTVSVENKMHGKISVADICVCVVCV